MSLEQQIERLNQNLETLVGAIAASNGIVAKMLASGNAVHANTVTDSNPADGKVETQAAENTGDEKPGRGRPKTRYFKHKDGGQAVKTSGVGPGSDWSEITKAEYDAMNLSSAKAAQESQKPAAPADEDPFADDEQTSAPTKTYTLDDVREVGLKLRDATSADVAKALIATFGVAKLAELPASKWADFIDAANAKIKEVGDDGL